MKIASFKIRTPYLSWLDFMSKYPKIQGLNFFAKPWKYIHIFYMLLTQTTGFRIYGWPKWFSTRIRRLSSVESEQGPDLVIVLTLTCQEILEWHVILEISSEISTIIKTKINSMRVAKKICRNGNKGRIVGETNLRIMHLSMFPWLYIFH